MMMNDATREYINVHAQEDVGSLALRGCSDPAVDMQTALQQIAGRQAARSKLPSWAARSDIYYPPHLSMEQCSSEATARYKAEIAGTGQRFVDLTTGFGVDAAYIAPNFSEVTCVERQQLLTAVTAHNFAVLGLRHVEIVNDDCTDYLHRMESADLVMIDPARRDDNGKRTYSIADCQPNVLEMLGELTAKADRLLIKLSPMLDIHKAVNDIEASGKASVCAVHVVAVKNECKELLLELRGKCDTRLKTVCVNLLADGVREVFQYQTPAPAAIGLSPTTMEWNYLYEPNAAIMKAGCFDLLGAAFGIAPLGPNSHLFVAETPVTGFPGRGFVVDAVSSVNKKELRQTLGHLDRANIAVRNFPLSAKALREQLKLGDGGDTYIFATTAPKGKVIFVGRKILSMPHCPGNAK